MRIITGMALLIFAGTAAAENVLFDLQLPEESDWFKLELTARPYKTTHFVTGTLHLDSGEAVEADGDCRFPRAETGSMRCFINGRTITADITSFERANRDEWAMTFENVEIVSTL